MRRRWTCSSWPGRPTTPTPLAAFGMPQASFTVYPAETSGRQRVVEVLLTYPEEVSALRDKQTALKSRVAAMEVLLRGLTGQEAARTAFAMVRENAAYLPFGGSSTAYGALVEGGADSEGLRPGHEAAVRHRRCGVHRGGGYPERRPPLLERSGTGAAAPWRWMPPTRRVSA